MPLIPRGERGFGLLEVIIAGLVLGLAMLMTAPMIHYSVRRSGEARKVTAAQLLGNQVLERLRLEVRYDAEPASANTVVGGPGFTLADAWKSDRLPYSSQDSVAADGCHPAGAADPIDYDVGPFAARHEGNEFLVCYDLEPSARPDVPANSVEATVKVIWRNGDAFAARWITGVLLSGR